MLTLVGYPAPTRFSDNGLREGLCGERVDANSRLVAIAKSHKPFRTGGDGGEILVIDTASGDPVRTVQTTSDPVDVVLMPTE